MKKLLVLSLLIIGVTLGSLVATHTAEQIPTQPRMLAEQIPTQPIIAQ